MSEWLAGSQSSRDTIISLSSAADVCVPAQGKVIVPTDLAVAIPEGCYGRIGEMNGRPTTFYVPVLYIAPRSSMAWKYHLDVGAGVIDADYRGNMGVVLFNLSQKPYEGITIIIS